MNATPLIERSTFPAFSAAQPCPFTHAAQTLHAVSASLVAGAQAAEKLAAAWMATSGELLDHQISAVASLAQLNSPQEVLDVQQQFARRAWAAYSANAAALASAVQQLWTP